MKIGTDAAGQDPDSARGNTHPRRTAPIPRILGNYVRDERVLPLEDAVRKMTGAVAQRLLIRDRGLLRAGMYADVVVFDPATIRENSTYERPHQLSTGVREVFVNGVEVVRDGRHTARSRARSYAAWGGAATRSTRDDAARVGPDSRRSDTSAARRRTAPRERLGLLGRVTHGLRARRRRELRGGGTRPDRDHAHLGHHALDQVFGFAQPLPLLEVATLRGDILLEVDHEHDAHTLRIVARAEFGDVLPLRPRGVDRSPCLLPCGAWRSRGRARAPIGVHVPKF